MYSPGEIHVVIRLLVQPQSLSSISARAKRVVLGLSLEGGQTGIALPPPLKNFVPLRLFLLPRSFILLSVLAKKMFELHHLPVGNFLGEKFL